MIGVIKVTARWMVFALGITMVCVTAANATLPSGTTVETAGAPLPEMSQAGPLATAGDPADIPFSDYKSMEYFGAALRGRTPIRTRLSQNFGDGTHEEITVDLRVKVLGGYVEHRRILEKGGRWVFNPNWADLDLIFEDDGDFISGDRPQSISRNGYEYRKMDGGNSYLYDQTKRIYPIDDGYRWSDNRGNTIDYDIYGQMVAYADRNGVEVRFERDSAGNITRILDHHGNLAIEFHYDAQGRLLEAVDRSGRSVQYQYGNNGLSEVVGPMGERWIYTYRTRGDEKWLINVTLDTHGSDPGNGRLFEREIVYEPPPTYVCVSWSGGRWVWESQLNTWSNAGRRCLRFQRYYQDPLFSAKGFQRRGFGIGDGNTWEDFQFSYDVVSQEYQQIHMDGSGKLSVRGFDLNGELVSESINGRVVRRYERADRRTVITEANGDKTTIEKDRWGNRVKISHPDGSQEYFEWNTEFQLPTRYVNENGVATEYEYDSRGNLIRRIVAGGTASQREVMFQYDEFGQMTQRHELGTGLTPDRVERFEYDHLGNIISYTGGEQSEWQFRDYHVLGMPRELIDPAGNAWQRGYDTAGNKVLEETPLGQVTQYEYTGDGRLISVIDNAGEKTTFSYNKAGGVTTVRNPLGNQTRIEYNATGHIKAIVDSLGNREEFLFTREGKSAGTVDASGYAVEMEYDSVAGDRERPPTTIRTPAFEQYIEYDAKNRPVKMEYRGDGVPNRLTEIEYDSFGNVIRLLDPVGDEYQFNYDSMGRPRLFRNPDGNLTHVEYDQFGSMTRINNPRGIDIRQYQYDKNQRLIKEITPDGETTQYAYDSRGNLNLKIDSIGQAIRYGYDSDSRLVRVLYFEDQSKIENFDQAVRDIQFHYDEMSRLSGYTDAETSAQYSYDAAGRFTGAVIDYGAFTLSYTYAHYANGRVKSFTAPDGVTYTYRYRGNGDLSEIAIPGEGTYAIHEYNWRAPSRVMLPGGGERIIDYDSYLQPSNIQGRDSAGNIVQEFSYDYRIEGAIESIERQGVLTDYGYDALDRLSKERREDYDNDFYYDPVGNRLGEKDFRDADSGEVYVWKYDDRDRLLSRGPIEYDYDANGNMIWERDARTGQERYFYYDVDNRLTRITDGSGDLIGEYAYDPFGQRIWESTQNGSLYFAYSREGLVAEVTSTGVVETSYGFEPGGLWTTNPLFIRQQDKYGYYQNDHLGTPQNIISGSGSLLWRIEYNSFGEVEVIESNGMTNNLRFPGQYVDVESGLHYNWHRYYSPEMGRYIQSDRIGVLGGLNTYAYASSNPIIYVDVNGLFLQVVIARVVLQAVVGAVCNAVRSMGDGCETLKGAVGGASGVASLVTDQIGEELCQDSHDCRSRNQAHMQQGVESTNSVLAQEGFERLHNASGNNFRSNAFEERLAASDARRNGRSNTAGWRDNRANQATRSAQRRDRWGRRGKGVAGCIASVATSAMF